MELVTEFTDNHVLKVQSLTDELRRLKDEGVALDQDAFCQALVRVNPGLAYAYMCYLEKYSGLDELITFSKICETQTLVVELLWQLKNAM